MSNVLYINKPSLKVARNRKDVSIIYETITNLGEHLFKDGYFFIHTYGCQANVRDEETMTGLLTNSGLERTNNVENATVIILNTCAVRENAELKLYGEIGKLKRLKKQKEKPIIIVSGCVVQQEEALELLINKYRHIDIFMGTNRIHHLLDLIKLVKKTNKRVVDVPSDDTTICEGLPVKRNEDFKAFVNITYGCDKFCTYCIVPYTRGKERSRKKEEILKECKTLVKQGYQEITLLGQNVNAYGLDLNDGSNFASLLEEVAKLSIPRLRFLTSHPWNFTNELIDVMSRYSNIMKYLHLPFQAGNNEVLQRMGRRYTKESYLELVNKIRAKMPSIALSTDIIVGFPGETNTQFEDTLDVVRKVGFSSAFTFIYSPRIGTPAARFKDETSKEEKSERFNLLKEEVEKVTEAYAQKLVGTIQKVLVDGFSKKDPNKLSGYTECNKLVHFNGGIYLVGNIVDVKIEYSKVYSLQGKIVE